MYENVIVKLFILCKEYMLKMKKIRTGIIGFPLKCFNFIHVYIYIYIYIYIYMLIYILY
jgi:hypothetical protein